MEAKFSHFGNPPGISQLERQLEIEPLNDPAVPFQGISPKGSISYNWSSYMSIFIADLFIHNSQKVQSPQMFINWWNYATYTQWNSVSSEE